MFGLGHRAAGVSIDQTGIRYISFKNKNPRQVNKKRFMPLLPGMIVENQVADREALLDRLRQWVKTKGLRGSVVNLSIPPSQMIIRKMMISSTVEKQIDQLVKLEVETALHLPFENPVYDYVITEQGENESQMLIFAAPRKVIQDYVEVLEDAGLRIRSVEVSATSLARSIVAGYGHSFNETMLIHMEQSLMDIYMYRNGDPVFMRTINLVDLQPENLRDLNLNPELSVLSEAEAAAATQEHLSPEQMVEVTAEISRMLSFYQYSLHDGSTQITEMLITGSPELRSQLHQELQTALPELAIAPIAVNQFAEGVKPDFSLNDYRVAAGAALREGKIRNINLLPREDRETVLFPYVAMTLASIWVLVAIGSGILYVSTQGQVASQSAEIQNVQDQNVQQQLELSGLNNASSTGQVDREAIIKAISMERQDAAAVLDELNAQLPYGGVIRDINYTAHTELLLTVNFINMENSTIYLTALRQMSFSTSASIQKLTEGITGTSTALAGGGVPQTIKYTAVYKVDMAPLEEQQTPAAVSAEGGTESSGTDQ